MVARIEPAFHGQMQRVPVEVRRCENPACGEGVFALRPLEKGEVIFLEKPVVVVPDLWAGNAMPACALCLASHVANPWGARVPAAATRWPQFRPVACEGGCGAAFCHRFCQRRAAASGHARWCGNAEAHRALWAYCDTELPEAWDAARNVMVLGVRLTALLLAEREDTQGDPAAERPVWQFYESLVGGATNRVAYWAPAALYALTCAALGMSEEERAFFTGEHFADLLGKLMCNCIELRALSAFSQYMANSRPERRRNSKILTELVDLAECLSAEEERAEAEAETATARLLGGDEGAAAEAETAAARRRASAEAEASGGEEVRRRMRGSEMDRFFAARTGVSGVGVFALHCKLNHSCDPNAAVVSGSFVDATIEVVATRAIAEGEEVCVSYTNPKLSKAQRRKILLANHFFHCTCCVCVAPAADAAVGSDGDGDGDGGAPPEAPPCSTEGLAGAGAGPSLGDGTPPHPPPCMAVPAR